LICVTWLIDMCAMTHWYVWHDSLICVTWLIDMCDMTHWYVYNRARSVSSVDPAGHYLCVAWCTRKRHRGVSQCVVVCCSVLMCVAASVAVCWCALQHLLQYADVRCSIYELKQTPSRCVAVCCSMWQCVAVYGSVLQCVAVCCSVHTLQHTATHHDTPQHPALHSNTPQHTTTHHKYTTAHFLDIMHKEHSAQLSESLWCVAVCCSMLQGAYTATHCNTLQHTATHCNTLQHTATHCNTLTLCKKNIVLNFQNHC